MGRSSADDKILCYNDVVLRRSDLDILSGPYYLNDRIIEFYFSYLSSLFASEDILLIPPSIAFWITNCPNTEDVGDFVAPLKLHEKSLVIFPVNDNGDVELAEGGSHWSLLAYTRKANLFVHHDSLGIGNEPFARQLHKAVVRYMSSPHAGSDARFHHCSDSPRQHNGYDCGLYVTATAGSICQWFHDAKLVGTSGLWYGAVTEQVTASAVAEMRDEILQLIKHLMSSK